MVLAAGEPAVVALGVQAKKSFCLLPNGGKSLEQPIDLEDLTTALQAAIQEDTKKNYELNLAGPESIPRFELIRRIAALHNNNLKIFPIPSALIRSAIRLMSALKMSPPITLPMYEILEQDDRIDPEPACKQLGIALTPLADSIQRYWGS